MMETIGICLFGAVDAFAQTGFAAEFSSAEIRLVQRSFFCITGGIIVNLLPVSGNVKLLIFTLLLYGWQRIFLKTSPGAAAVCTTASVTIMQACFGLMGAVEGMAVITALRFGILLRGGVVIALGNLLPIGLYWLLGRRISDIRGLLSEGKYFRQSKESVYHNFGFLRLQFRRVPNASVLHSGQIQRHTDFSPLYLLPGAAIAVYINSSLMNAADTEGKGLLLFAAAHGAVILWTAGFFDSLDRQEMCCMLYELAERRRREMSDSASVRHDLKNHLLVLSSFISRGEYERARGYISGLGADIHSYGDFCTGSTVLDALLCHKLSGFPVDRVSCRIDAGADLGRLSDRDICIIFGNIVDNAVNACGISGDSGSFYEKAFIDLRTVCQGERLLIECRNYCVSGEFIEGTGLGNIRRAAAKYGGIVTARAEGNMFVLRVLILDK